ncbi:Phosphatidylinositol N-acetylglucosaminyltransferase subunit gpi15 [Orchesella cincta]|uniref:Phosphatidylinositol N-acetylglucosaminyltransferase subunit gpi15 n=1 Tax=Orchesella cincta TaxID=48709 RepID=A0A1D2NAT0_ORCCI|nr:Phosphatidylinositol N-acetylglucosaminyltransferase subunit gpi15 [Orchesella cincta]
MSLRLYVKRQKKQVGLRDGYDILEYVVETEDKRLMPVLRFPSVAIVCIVILWSFSLMTTGFGACTVLVVVLWGYSRVHNTVVKETLFIISTLGIQVSQTNILGRMKHAKFVPIDNIKAVVINEIIRRVCLCFVELDTYHHT